MAKKQKSSVSRVIGPVGMEKQPINNMVWVQRDELTSNDYNPNKVASTELHLLMTSLIEDGWTHPVVARADNVLVDGFHRWTLSGKKEIGELTNYHVPVVYLEDRGASHNRMSTIRHNRARGSHGVMPMAEIMQDFIKEGLSMEEISFRLSMEEEEVTRLALQVGIPETDIIRDSTFSKSWVPKK